MRWLGLGALAFALTVGAQTLLTVPSGIKLAGSCFDRTVTWDSDEVVTAWEVQWRPVYAVGNALRFDTPIVSRLIPFADGPGVTIRVGRAGLYQVRVRACVAGTVPSCSAWSDSNDPAVAEDSLPFLVYLFVCPPTA